MKKLLGLLLIIALIFTIGCKDDNDSSNVLSPTSDTTVMPGYEEFSSDESDLDSSVTTDSVTTITQNNDTEPVMVEDTTGNIQPATDTDINNSNKNFYIIVGSYQNINNAQIRMQYFKNQGYAAEILPKFGTYNRVSIAKFNQEATCRAELKSLRAKFHDNSFWLLLR